MKDEYVIFCLKEEDVVAFDLSRSELRRRLPNGEVRVERIGREIGYVHESLLDQIEREARDTGNDTLLEKAKTLRARLGR